ncbi:MAG: 2,3-bisphosphoglycerate-independent phosphoglycerate mutase [Oscillospiraceae bacterium]|nr:2,3-bisphosphoglycerate-independent phosphoglycerate mutase [Oscillospiraceae bacterium]
MKHFILVPDGCADRPAAALGGRTPLEAARLTHINALAKVSETGLVKTIPDGVEPGSDAANLSILGYDPAVCLTGRAPLEAAAMGLPMAENDVAFRASLVTLEGSGAFEDMTVKDHSAGEIGDAEAGEIIRMIDRELGGDGLRFYPGVSYRCLLITDRLDVRCKMTPPHDILGRRAGDYLPDDAEVRRLMAQSAKILKGRRANAIWIWGQGKRLTLPSLAERYGVTGSMVAAVNLLKGIGRCAGLDCPHIPGATGTLHTSYEGKAAGAIEAFKRGADFVFIHVEAPDECSHTGDLEGKLQSLEWIDEKVFKPVADYLAGSGEPYRALVMPDHRTPVALRTHTAEPVPFILYDSQNPQSADEAKAFSEACGARGRFFGSGKDLADWFFRR